VKKIWLTTDGRPHDAVLGIFSSETGAARYRDLLVERYSLGKSLSVMGKPIARDADSWQLGLGPEVVERTLDDKLDYLRGAWVVKVDAQAENAPLPPLVLKGLGLMVLAVGVIWIVTALYF